MHCGEAEEVGIVMTKVVAKVYWAEVLSGYPGSWQA